MKTKTLIGLAALCSALSGCGHKADEYIPAENLIPPECVEILNAGFDSSAYFALLSCKDKDGNIIFYKNRNWEHIGDGEYKLTLKKLMPELKERK